MTAQVLQYVRAACTWQIDNCQIKRARCAKKVDSDTDDATEVAADDDDVVSDGVVFEDGCDPEHADKGDVVQAADEGAEYRDEQSCKQTNDAHDDQDCAHEVNMPRMPSPIPAAPDSTIVSPATSPKTLITEYFNRAR